MKSKAIIIAGLLSLLCGTVAHAWDSAPFPAIPANQEMVTTRTDINAALLDIYTNAAQKVEAGGLPWDDSIPYVAGQSVTAGSSLFISIQSGNLNHATTDPAWWVEVSGSETDWTQSGQGTIHASNYVDNDTHINQAGIETFGFVTGAHTVDTDTHLDQTGVEALGFVTGAHTVDTNTQLSDGEIAAFGYIKTQTDDQTATEVPFTPFSTIAATNAQAAIEEVFNESTGGTDDQVATEVPFTPFSTIAATNTQAAIEEVFNEAAGGTDDQVAVEVPIADAGGLITAIEVEAALQELMAAININTDKTGLPAGILNYILQYNGSAWIAQDHINGLINDTAGDGDTTEIWSADKTYDEIQAMSSGGCTWAATDPNPATMSDGQCIISTSSGNTFRRNSNGLGYTVAIGNYTTF